jgi:hypothetical protein
MAAQFMVLPSKDNRKTRLVKMPDDYEEHEVYRAATGAIARIEDNLPGYDWDDLMEELEDMGFEEIPFLLGPEV